MALKHWTWPMEVVVPYKGDEEDIEKAVLAKLGRLALMYGGLGTVLGTLIWGYRYKQNKKQAEKAVKSWLNATLPVISIDPSTRDFVSEERLRELGLKELEKAKGAGDPKDRPKRYRVERSIGDLSKDPKAPKWLVAGLLGVPVLSLAAGMQLGRYLVRSREKELTEEEIRKLRNLQDALVFEQFIRSRTGKAPTNSQWHAFLRQQKETPKSAGWFEATKKWWIAYALGAFLLSLSVGYKRGKKEDPGWKQYKALRRALLQEQYLQNQPTLLEEPTTAKIDELIQGAQSVKRKEQKFVNVDAGASLPLTTV